MEGPHTRCCSIFVWYSQDVKVFKDMVHVTESGVVRVTKRLTAHGFLRHGTDGRISSTKEMTFVRRSAGD